MIERGFRENDSPKLQVGRHIDTFDEVPQEALDYACKVIMVNETRLGEAYAFIKYSGVQPLDIEFKRVRDVNLPRSSYEASADCSPGGRQLVPAAQLEATRKAYLRNIDVGFRGPREEFDEY